jgi:GNAT superfamily N-acetyltransferase
MSRALAVEPLAQHPELVPLLSEWFVSEWPGWYGRGGQGNITEDLKNFAASDSNLPVGFVIFSNGAPVGAGALKAESIRSHTHLSPWAGAGFVIPEERGQGVGAFLLWAKVANAQTLGFRYVYCGTGTAESLLQRSGWSTIEVIEPAGKSLTIFRGAA